MSEIVDRLRELSADEDPDATITVSRDEADDLVELIDHLQHHELD